MSFKVVLYLELLHWYIHQFLHAKDPVNTDQLYELQELLVHQVPEGQVLLKGPGATVLVYSSFMLRIK